jgi:hypothetical protein
MHPLHMPDAALTMDDIAAPAPPNVDVDDGSDEGGDDWEDDEVVVCGLCRFFKGGVGGGVTAEGTLRRW